MLPNHSKQRQGESDMDPGVDVYQELMIGIRAEESRPGVEKWLTKQGFAPVSMKRGFLVLDASSRLKRAFKVPQVALKTEQSVEPPEEIKPLVDFITLMPPAQTHP